MYSIQIMHQYFKIECSASKILQILFSKRLTMIYSNVETALRIYLCILSTNAIRECPFSVVKRDINYLRNSISNVRLSALAFFSANKDLVNSTIYDKIIIIFAQIKVRNHVTIDFSIQILLTFQLFCCLLIKLIEYTCVMNFDIIIVYLLIFQSLKNDFMQ